MIDDVRKLLDNYMSWLRERISLREVGEWVEITTPYLDRNNDYMQIYAQRSNGAYVLTDDGYVIQDLEQAGCKLDSPKRQELLRMTLNGFGVQLNSKTRALETHASTENFPLRKHSLLQAMLATNDLFFLAGPTVASLFYEDVVAWLELNEIRYTPEVKFTGKSGYDHLFNFIIPKSRRRPERILQAISRPSKETAQALAFAWIDIKEVRPPDAKAYALLNDSERPISEPVIEALRSYDVKAIQWTHREKVLEELVA